MVMKNLVVPALILFCYACGNTAGPNAAAQQTDSATATNGAKKPSPTTVLDTARYNELQTYLANGDTTGLWPVKHEYPVPGAVLPSRRVVAY